VVTRQSSDVLAIHDEAIAKAVRYVRENADKSIKVNDMVSASGISRRSLELKFIEHVGATPLEEIHRINSIALSNSWSRPTCQSLSLRGKPAFATRNISLGSSNSEPA
jgi:methylphosphotriester-DNA--protein-cysteine methyltransferase